MHNPNPGYSPRPSTFCSLPTPSGPPPAPNPSDKIDWPAVWRECDRRLPSMDHLAPWHMVTVQEVVNEQLEATLKA